MKKCKDCNITKQVSEFYVHGKNKTTGEIWYRGRCCKCHNLKFKPATGRISSTRFKKGNVPMSKKVDGGRHSLKHKDWILMVFERDLHTCQKCFSTDKLEAHHIKHWNRYPELRFELSNGMTLCKSCHSKVHSSDKKSFKKGNIPWNKGTKGIMAAWNKGLKGVVKLSEETKKKMSETHKSNPNKTSFKKGHKLSEKAEMKRRESLKGQIPWNKGLKMKKDLEA